MIANLLNSIAGLGCFVCFVLVLIKQFQREGPVQGIMGIVTCGIWTFIWGWLNARLENINGLMSLWSFLVIIEIILNILGFLTMRR